MILITMKGCIKCSEVEVAAELLGLDLEIIEYPNFFNEWTAELEQTAHRLKVFDDLQNSRIPLLIDENKRIYGQLRIIKYLREVSS